MRGAGNWHGRSVARRVVSAMAASVLAAIASLAIGSPALADRIRDAQWHLPFLDITKAHQLSQGEGVTVAVIDTGISAEHPDLAGNVLQGFDVVAGGSGTGIGDTDGHGTGMAGLVAAHGHGQGNGDGALGMAPKAKILPIRIAAGDSGTGNSAAMANAVDGAVQRGAKIISISQRTTADKAYDAVQRAVKAGVIVVASVGNRPREEFIGDPAAWPGVVAVGAVGKDGNVADISVHGKALVLTAPGVDITSTGRGSAYRVGTGTSPSTAIVAGVAALVWSKYPNLTSTQVIDHMTATATDKGAAGRDPDYGFGVVNPVKALSTTPAPPSASPSEEGARIIPRTSPKDEPQSKVGMYVAIGAGILVLAAILAGALLLRRRRS
jgi:type VII secretion-associated serine protease mycosin